MSWLLTASLHQHVRNFQHAFVVKLALRLFVSVFSIYLEDSLSIIASLRVNVGPVCVRFVGITVRSAKAMIIRRENLGESVSHFELAKENPTKSCSIRVETSIYHGMTSGRRLAVVYCFIR